MQLNTGKLKLQYCSIKTFPEEHPVARRLSKYQLVKVKYIYKRKRFI